MRKVVISDSWDSDWIAHPDATPDNPDMEKLIERRADIEVLSEWSDPDASYEYDMLALVRLDDEFFVLATSGCSCPSPTETWWVELAGTESDVRAHLTEQLEAYEKQRAEYDIEGYSYYESIQEAAEELLSYWEEDQ